MDLTHTREFDSAVTTLGRSALLFNVEISQFAAWSFNDADFVRPRVVPISKLH